jgi:hypothetical protein
MIAGSELRLQVLSVFSIALAAMAYDPQPAFSGVPSGCSPEEWASARCAAEAACNGSPPIFPGGCMQGSVTFCWHDETGQAHFAGSCWELPAESCPVTALPCG